MEAPALYECLKGMGVGKGYASAIANGHRKPGLKLAIRLFRITGAKLGPISTLTSAEIDALEKMGARRAPQ